MKEAIFHPEARAEMSESFDFYELRLDGLGVKFLSAVEQTVERISTHPEMGAPLTGEFRKRIVPGLFGKIIFTSLLWLIIVVGQIIGANEPIVANHRAEKDAVGPRLSPDSLDRHPFESRIYWEILQRWNEQRIGRGSRLSGL